MFYIINDIEIYNIKLTANSYFVLINLVNFMSPNNNKINLRNYIM